MRIIQMIVLAKLCKLVKKIVGQDKEIRFVFSVHLCFKFTVGDSFPTVGGIG